MNQIISLLFVESQSESEAIYSKALSDLRFVIERHTMNRYGKEEVEEYLMLFYRKDLINYKISIEEMEVVKFFLIYMLLNFPNRSLLIAKCLKILFEKSIEEAICNGIELYMRKDDNTTSELIYAIINAYDDQSYFSNERINTLFSEIRKQGGRNSREVVENEVAYCERVKGSGNVIK